MVMTSMHSDDISVLISTLYHMMMMTIIMMMRWKEMSIELTLINGLEMSLRKSASFSSGMVTVTVAILLYFALRCFDKG